MSDSWTTTAASNIKSGERIRHRGEEFDVARIDAGFLGMANMLCFIEDTPSRWRAHPAMVDADIEVHRG